MKKKRKTFQEIFRNIQESQSIELTMTSFQLLRDLEKMQRGNSTNTCVEGNSSDQLEGRKENKEEEIAGDKENDEPNLMPDRSKVLQSEARSLMSQLKSEVQIETRKDEKRETSCHDRKDDTVMKPFQSKLLPSQARVLLAQLKSKVQSEMRKEEMVANNCCNEENDETIVLSHHYKLPPRETNVELLAEEHITKQTFKRHGITGQSHCIEGDDQRHHKEEHITKQTFKRHGITGQSPSFEGDDQRHHKVPVNKPLEHDSGKGTSLLEVSIERHNVVENSEYRNQEGKSVLCPISIGVKYAPASKQSTGKEASGLARNGSDKKQGNSKKRKASDHISTVCLVPKQVKLATASCLIETGGISYPSVGTVVVECLPSATAQKEGDRAVICNPKNGDARKYYSLQGSCFKSGKDMSNRDADEENRSCASGKERKDTSTNPKNSAETQSLLQPSKSREDTASTFSCSVGRGVQTTCKEISDGVNRDGLKALLPGLISVAHVGGSRTLEDPVSKNPLLQSSRIHFAPSSSRPSHSSALPFSSAAHQHSSSLGAGSATCSYNVDNSSYHEIAGITMQRRSWEALKAAGLLAKRRFVPKTGSTSGITVPSIPSRFQHVKDFVQGVSNCKPGVGTHFSYVAALPGSAAGNTNAVLAEKVGSQRRGPKQGQHERLSIKVLNKSVQNFVNLKDSSCPSGVDSNRVTQNQIEAHISTNGGYNRRPPCSYSGAQVKEPPLKTRQRRGHKKLEKEKLRMSKVKTTSSACHFKPLSEPSGLLGDFHPGIMQRVRNSQQIHAILGALIGAASSTEAREDNPSSLPELPQDSACVLVKTEDGGEVKEKSVEVLERLHENGDSTQDIKCVEKKSVEVLERLHENGDSTQEKGCVKLLLAIGSGSDNDPTLKVQDRDLQEEMVNQSEALLSKEVQREPLGVRTETHQDLPETDHSAPLKEEALKADLLHQHSESMLSTDSRDPEYAEESHEPELPAVDEAGRSPAAGLAGRWLELLTLDIEGRLSALERSRRRVQSTLLSGQLASQSGSASVSSVDPPASTHSMDMDTHGSQQSVRSDPILAQACRDNSSTQVDRWHALFTNMDAVLGKEAAKLESSLWQIQQMQAFCPILNREPFSVSEKSHFAFCQGLAASTLEIEKQPPHRWPLTIEAIEKELGVAASAASILSTANFVTKIKSLR